MRKQSSYIFADKNFRADGLHSARQFEEQGTSGIVESTFFARITEGLARETSADNIDFICPFREINVVYIFFDDAPRRSVQFEGGTRIVIHFVEHDVLNARLFEAQCEPAGAGKEFNARIGALGHGVHFGFPIAFYHFLDRSEVTEFGRQIVFLSVFVEVRGATSVFLPCADRGLGNAHYICEVGGGNAWRGHDRKVSKPS